MPFLFISSAEKRRTVEFTAGPSLRDLLDMTDLRVRSGCRGSGACGLCRVRVEGAEIDGPTQNETFLLSQEDLRHGIRLACQVAPKEDLSLTIINPAPKSSWRSLRPEEVPAGPGSFPAPIKKIKDDKRYGVAVDLGTTHISLSLWDMAENRRLSGRFGRNLQAGCGSDVMTRLVYADASAENAETAGRAARDSISDGLRDICSREGYDPKKIGRITVVANTAMLCLLARRNFELLLRPEYWAREIDCAPASVNGWFEGADLDQGVPIEIVQPLAGFVGSDLLAGVIATRMTEGDSPALLVDFGTNSEIALWDGRLLWVTSAAGGPAFEGSGISCGMPAGDGAVYRIDGPAGGPGPVARVIGNGRAEGLCGSGMVGLVAYMVRTGRLDRIGNFGAGCDHGLPEEIRRIMPQKKDIDTFQRAKAAIGAGIELLSARAGAPAEDIRRVSICGVFGRYLNVINAIDIGLLPPVPPESVELCGNAALAGCESLLLSHERRKYLNFLRKKCKLVNLSQAPEFEDLFLRNLYLQPGYRLKRARGKTEAALPVEGSAKPDI